MNCVENLDGEIWRYVMSEEIGFWPYMVSNMGRVKSLNYAKTGDEKLLNTAIQRGGYFFVNLYKKGKHKMFQVHRLVALMFIKNPDNLPCVNHKDEDKTNNNVENLEWCTHKENINYGTCIERMVESRKKSDAWKEGVVRGAMKRIEKQNKKVYQYTIDGELVNVYTSVKEATQKNNCSQGNISKCCNGKRKTANNFIWSYEPLPTSTNQLSLFPTTETEKKLN